MDEKNIRLSAQLATIEYFIVQLLAFNYQGAAPDEVRASTEQGKEVARRLTVPGLQAAMSDLLAAEIEDNVERILEAVMETMELMAASPSGRS